MPPSRVVAGIFTGGRGHRMGFVAKGLLTLPSGETLLSRWLALFDALGVEAVLVGRHEAYDGVRARCLDDCPAGIGPLGGLAALLHYTHEGHAVAVACDMPFASPALVSQLVRAASRSPIVSVRRDNRWEPFFARYDARPVLALVAAQIARGEFALQRLLGGGATDELVIDPVFYRELDDWDLPSDLRLRRPRPV